MANAPDDLEYLLNASSAELPNSRQLAVDEGLLLVDGGPGDFLVIQPHNMLAALQELAATGFTVRTATDTMAARSLTSGGTISITNPAGVAGNPVLDVVPNTTNQLFTIFSNGSSVGSYPTLNLIPGTNMGVSCVVNGPSNRIDCTLSSNPGASISALYWVSTNTPALSQEVNIGALASGILQIETVDGVATPSSIPLRITSDTTDHNLGIGDNTGTAPGGIGNTYVGDSALSSATSSANTTCLGYEAGTNRLAYTACTFIGQGADASTTGLTNANAIGAGSVVGASNTMVLGANGTKIVIGDSTAQNGNYALNLDETGSSASVWMGRSVSQTAPSIGGGVYSVDNNHNPRFTSFVSAQSGQLVVAAAATEGSLLVGDGNIYDPLPIGTSGQVLKSNGTTAVWASDAGTTVSSGQATLTAGSSGTITLAGVTGTSKIVATYYGTTSNPGILSITLGSGNFTINSSNGADASTVAWHAIV